MQIHLAIIISICVSRTSFCSGLQIEIFTTQNGTSLMTSFFIRSAEVDLQFRNASKGAVNISFNTMLNKEFAYKRLRCMAANGKIFLQPLLI